jgi:predicted Zn-ribbon and HTH transcriptional regulator
MISLSKRDIDVKPLWEYYKNRFLVYKDHISYHEREGMALNFYEALKNTDVLYKEIIDVLIKPNEQSTFAKMNMHNNDLQKPENAELLKSVEKYELVRNALFNLEKNLLGRDRLVCDNCGYIFHNQRCPKCLGYSKQIKYELYENLEYFDEIVDIYTQMPESRDLLNSFINIIDKEIIQTVYHLIFNKADIFEFINSYLREFLNNEKYLAVFSSLKNLKDRIDKKEIVPSPINNVEDEGTITLGDPDED